MQEGSTQSLWNDFLIDRRTNRELQLPKIYAILDGGFLRSAGLDLQVTAMSLRDAGVLLLQYRDKLASETEVLANARAVGAIFKGSGATLVLNDFPHLVADAGWGGVHVGQTDTTIAEARLRVGPDRLVGISTHTPEQFSRAAETDADYIAYGPIFPTKSKPDAETTVGLYGLHDIRRLDPRPLVAIGGISRERMTEVFAAGADSVALISALYQDPTCVVGTVSKLLEAADEPA